MTQGKSPKTKVPSFSHSLPMSLLRARESVMKKFTPSLQAHGLSAQQWRVMRALNDENNLNISSLAERCYLLKPSLSRIIQNLEGRKIISRIQSSVDQRHSVVSLTHKGRQLFTSILPLSEERYAHISEKFGQKKLQQLYNLLDDLVETLDN